MEGFCQIPDLPDQAWTVACTEAQIEEAPAGASLQLTWSDFLKLRDSAKDTRV